MTISKRLWVLNALFLVGLGAIAGLTIYSIRNLRELNELSAQGLTLEKELISFASFGKDLLSTANLERTLEKWVVNYDGFESTYKKVAESSLWKRTLAGGDGSRQLEIFEFTWGVGQAQVKAIREVTETLISRHKEQSVAVSGLLYGYNEYKDMDFISAIAKVQGFSDLVDSSLVPMLNNLVSTVQDGIRTSEAALTRDSLIMAGGAGGFIFILFFLFARSLRRRLAQLRASMQALKDRDYTAKIALKGRDELAEMAAALNGFIDDLSGVIAGVKNISNEAGTLKNEVAGATVQSSAAISEMTANIASISAQIREFVDNLGKSNQAVGDIKAGIDSLEGRIANHASFVSRSGASIEEMTASIGNVAAIADKRVAAASRLVEITKTGGSMIDRTSADINGIVKQIGEIGAVVGIINGIAGRTNLLSMNAAIEAAHAGDSGRGFAVVAEEIRSLADSTNQNSKRVKTMIQGITAKIQQVLSSSEESRHAFADVDTEVDSTSKALAEISFAMKELSEGSREIMKSIIELSGIAKALEGDASVMKDRVGRVSDGMRNIDNAAGMVKNGITEIEAGTKDINAAMVHVNELQTRSGESVEQLVEKVSVFKTGT